MKTHAGADCRDLLDRLSRYVDGDLTGRERASLVAHLRRCPCCDEFAESLRRTIQVCHEAGHTRLPREVRARAKARIAALMAEEKC